MRIPCHPRPFRVSRLVRRWLPLALLLGSADRAISQAAPAIVGGQDMITVGGTFSGSHVSYGSRSLLGAGMYVDLDYNQHYGIEAEGRWLWLHQRDGVRDATYLIGPRYSFNGVGWEGKKFRPYAKFLVGLGDFRYPYGYATGRYFVAAPGGGVDYRISHLIRLRLIDAEYQLWPQFTYGRMSSFTLSTGVRFRVF